MKFLLELLSSRAREPAELISIVSDARESGLRDEKATIHEFIDTLERITNEIRSDPNAKAFLSRVKKAEAPDYYDIIKKPMDLGTVLKKVKSGAYKTKSAFNDDLELIWSNCFLYNSAMNLHLRVAAESLKTKANNLLKYVSEPSETGTIGGSGPPKPATRISIRPAKPHHPLVPSFSGIALAEKRWRMSARGKSLIGDQDFPADFGSDHNQPQSNVILRNFDSTPAEVAWEERPALIRQPDQMWNWYQDADQNEEYSLKPIPRDMLMCNLPELPFLSHSIQPPKSSKYHKKSHKHFTSRIGLSQSIESNIRTVWEIKKMHRKVADLSASTPSSRAEMDNGLEDERSKSSANGSDHETGNEGVVNASQGSLFQNSIPAEAFQTSLAGKAGYQVMKRIVTILMTHVGFDAAHSSAISCLTEIMIRYLENIGRTLHFFEDRFCPMLTPSEMIYQTLRSNGIGGLDQLDSYMKDDIEKYGSKLKDLLRKLQGSYVACLAGSTSKAFEDDDLFAKDGEALATGAFTNELGEDFFGIRELGLDSELGLSSLKIPSRLFHGQPKAIVSSQSVVQTIAEPEPRFVKPIPFIELKSEWIEEQIGLLQGVYRARLETKEFGLKDDSLVSRLPKIFRPKVPPSGKIPIKRRLLAPTGAGSGSIRQSIAGEGSSNKRVRIDDDRDAEEMMIDKPQKEGAV